MLNWEPLGYSNLHVPHSPTIGGGGGAARIVAIQIKQISMASEEILLFILLDRWCMNNNIKLLRNKSKTFMWFSVGHYELIKFLA